MTGTETETRLLDLAMALARELHPRHPPPEDTGLDGMLDRDFGFDSLGRVELLARIEHVFDLHIAERDLMAAETPRDLVRAIEAARRRKGGPRPKAVEAPATAPSGNTAAASAPPSLATLVEVLDWHADNHPDRLHIRVLPDDEDDDEPDDPITYADLRAGALRVAAGLQARDLAPGETVLIMLPSGRGYFETFMGILMAGGVPVPIYPPVRANQIEEHLLRHAAIAANAQAVILVTVDEGVRFAALMSASVPSMRAVLTHRELAQGGDGPPRRPRIDGADVAFLQYTSGSTGTPKGVVLTHANLLANIRAMVRAVKATPDDVFVSWLPLYHDMGLIGAWLGSMTAGCPLVIFSPVSFITRPGRWLRVIDRYRGTLSAAPNFAYEMCLARIEGHEIAGLDLGCWRGAFNGAEGVSPATVTRFPERFKACGFRTEALKPVYGLAECSVGLAFPARERPPWVDRVRRAPLAEAGRAEPAPDDDRTALSFVACGRALSGHEIRVVDGAGRELPDRREGRIQFRGPSATSGYHRNPEQTAKLFAGSWLETGDRGYLVDGDLFITGRAKDIIIRAGRNIYPEEIETAAAGVDGIRKGCVAAFGVVDPKSGTERLVVLAETREKDDGGALRRDVARAVADLAGGPPDEVVLAPPGAVLKTSSGKVRRDATRALFEAGDIGRTRRAVWWQVTRFALGAAWPRLRRALEGLGASLYAAWAWAAAAVIVPPLWLWVAAVPSRRLRWVGAGAAARAWLLLTGLRLRVSGRANLPGPGVPSVFVANHQSYLDGVLLAAALPEPPAFIAKAELQRGFFARVLLERLGCRFVERFDLTKSTEDARRLVEDAAAGVPLLFFAEGTFVRTPGLLPFRLGAFETAAKAGAAVVPIVIRGARTVLRGDDFFFRRAPLAVEIGPATEPAKGEDFKAAVDLRDRTRAWILAHCGEPDMEDERPALFQKNSP